MSIIIPVFNDWTALDSCLYSIGQQGHGSDSEVIVVDDGSEEPAPEKIRQWERKLPLNIVRQSHAGISSARNRGIQVSSGSILLFVDADSRLQTNCLSALESSIAGSPKHDYFQLHLSGNRSNLTGKAEHLRLFTIQSHALQPNGCIRYLNTAAFAIRRTALRDAQELFDPRALRGEDTLLLADLMVRGELPFLVTEALVQHEVPLSVLRCFRKEIRSALLEGWTYRLIASRGLRIRASHRERLSMLRSSWTASREPFIGKAAWLIFTIRQFLSRLTSFLYRSLHG